MPTTDPNGTTALSAVLDRLAALEIPAEYADDFRDAIIHEIENGTHAVRDALQDPDARGVPDELRGVRDADWRLAVRLLAQDGALLEQFGEGPDADDDPTVPIEGDAAALAHVCAAMAEKVIAPRLAHQLNYCPIDTAVAARVHELLERLKWATAASARLTDGGVDTVGALSSLTDEERAKLADEAAATVYYEFDLSIDRMDPDALAALRMQLDGYALLTRAPQPAFGVDPLRLTLERIVAYNREAAERPPSTPETFEGRSGWTAGERAEMLDSAQRVEANAREVVKLVRQLLGDEED